MSFLSTLLVNHFITALESAFLTYEPEAQQALLDEVKVLSDNVNEWLKNKIESKN